MVRLADGRIGASDNLRELCPDRRYATSAMTIERYVTAMLCYIAPQIDKAKAANATERR